MSDGQKSSLTNSCVQNSHVQSLIEPTLVTTQIGNQGKGLEASPIRPVDNEKATTNRPGVQLQPNTLTPPTIGDESHQDKQDTTKQEELGRSKRWRRAPRKFDQILKATPPTSMHHQTSQSSRIKHLWDEAVDNMEVDMGERKRTCKNSVEAGESSQL